MALKAELVAIGDELVSGQALDTNSQWLARSLAALGVETRFHSSICDDMDENLGALRHAFGRAELVVTTGGLGPTQDDLTREALARVAGVELVEDPASLAAIAGFFERRNRAMTERNRVQALFPAGSEPIANRVGTAPGIWMRLGRATCICLPGVPYEMKVMFEEQVAPRVRSLMAARGDTRFILERKLNLFGRGEADVEASALDLTARGREPMVGITASDATISFRVRSSSATETEAASALEGTLATIRARFADILFSEGDDELQHAVLAELARSGKTLAVAESCTGGLIADRVASLAGASEHFLGGVVSYSNASKSALLGVPAELIARVGAVSPEVAEAMAVGARGRFGSDLAVSVTGIAGPSGGTPEKPVGLVYLGLATAEGVRSRKLELGPEQPRRVIQSRSAKHALNWVRRELLGLE